LTKLAFYFTLICSLTGMMLFMPANPQFWGFYSFALVVHVLFGFGLLLFIGIVTFTHVKKGFKQMSKGHKSEKSFTGLWYFVTILIALGTGIFIGIRSGYALDWVVPVHLVAGFWCFLLSCKHSLKKGRKNILSQKSLENVS